MHVFVGQTPRLCLIFTKKGTLKGEPRKDIKQNYLAPVTHKGLPCDGHTAAIQKLGNYGRGNASHFMA